MTALPPQPSPPGARPAVAVAFCPAPPVLLPALEGEADGATVELRRACAEAVEAMLAVRPEVVVVVGDDVPDGIRFGAGDAGDLRRSGVDVELPFAGRVRPGGHRVPLPHALGAWLLDVAGSCGARVGVGPADVDQLVGGLPGPVGVLAMGDGSARRSSTGPGSLDAAAQSFDAAVATALGAGDAGALADLDEAEGARLLAAGVPTWRAVGAALAGRTVVARLHHEAAPFGVGYLVADWIAP
ncbi:MAG: uncharacterized protein JWR82_1081 [Blastococcus sp.]|nr:uncharacterized protein [Blastococcus sp.]